MSNGKTTASVLNFRDIQLSDRAWINELLKKSDFMGCEYSFANNMAWRRLYGTKICRYKDFYISCSFGTGHPVFTFPAGEGDYVDLFEQMRAFSKEQNAPLIVTSVTAEKLELLEKLFPDSFETDADEDYFDYIYNASDLINLAGKKYHNKRNHLKKLQALDWSFEPLSRANQDECIELSVNSYNDKGGYDDVSSVSEQFAINTFFNHFEELELLGGVIRVSGKVIAFTIGERLNSNTICTHIEKADAEIEGAYAAINNEFAKFAAADCAYINREEDLGLEGLRKSKRSYYPCFQLKKYTLNFFEKK